MKTCAIISEYNPFHNGHLYLYNKSKEITGADYCISLMSGNFTQRGIPAICDKYTRALMSVSSGIDLCLELPFVYASGSAYDFANGAINILNRLNTIDYLCFGAECDDIALFNEAADIITNEPQQYKSSLKSYLKDGSSYPYARQKAVMNCLTDLSEADLETVSKITSKPNNILALEYLAAIKRTNSKIEPVIIKRKNAEYTDEKINNSISSANAIRIAVKNKTNKESVIKALENDMPQEALNLLADNFNREFPVSPNALIPFLQSTLLNPDMLCNDICDMNPPIMNKLLKTDIYSEYSVVKENLKSKDITETRINRVILHLITGYTNKDRKLFYDNNTAFYANILAFRKSSSVLIKEINKNSLIPVITKKSDYNKYFSNYPDINKTAAERMWALDITASKLYGSIVYNSLGTHLKNDYETNIPIV